MMGFFIGGGIYLIGGILLAIGLGTANGRAEKREARCQGEEQRALDNGKLQATKPR
jgi:hypothetical protein